MSGTIQDVLQLQIDATRVTQGVGEARVSLDSLKQSVKDAEGQLQRLQSALDKQGNTSGTISIQALKKAVDDASVAQGNLAASTTTASTAQAQQTASVQGNADSLSRLRAQYDPLYAATQRYKQSLDDINRIRAQSNRADFDAAKAMETARANYDAQVNSINRFSTATTEAGGAVKLQAFQVTNLGYQVSDVFSQMSNGQFLAPLIQQTPQAIAAVGGTANAMALLRQNAGQLLAGGAIALVAAGLVGVGVAAESNARSLNETSTRLRLLRSDYAAAAADVAAATRTLVRTTSLGSTEARDALRTLVAIPGFQATQDQLVNLGKMANNLGSALGSDVAGGAEKLALVFQRPAEAAKQLSAELGDADGRFQRLIENMVAAGRTGEATAAIMERLSGRLESAAKTPLQKALTDLSNAFTGAGQSASDASNSMGTVFTGALASVITKIGEAVTAMQSFRTEMQNIQKYTSMKDLLGELWGGITGGPLDIMRSGARIGATMRGTFDRASGGGGAQAPIDTSRLAADIRPIINEAAERFGVDPELLARVQRQENPNRNADGSWPSSPVGARGAMQVMPATYAELAQKYNLPADGINDNRSNIMAGAAYLRDRLVKREGNVDLALGDYNAGPGTMNGFLSGTRSSLPNETVKYIQRVGTEGGYTGPGLTQRAANEDDVVSLTRPGAVTGGTPAGGFGGIDPRAAVDKLVKDTLARYENQSVPDRKASYQREIDTLEQALGNVARGSPEAATLSDAISKLRGNIYNTIEPTEQLARAQEQSQAGMREMSPGAQALTQAMAQYDETIRRSQGSVTDLAAREKYMENVRSGLNSAYDRSVFSVQQAIDSQSRMSGAYEQGAAAVLKATNYERAYQEVSRLAINGADAQAAAIAALAKKYDELTAAQATNALTARNVQTEQNIGDTVFQRQTLGLPDTERSALLARRNAERNAAALPEGTDPEQISRSIELAEASQRQYDITQRQIGVYRELQATGTQAMDSIFDATFQLAQGGKDAAETFRTSMISALQQVAKEMLALALLNPMKNALFGTNLGTAADAGGILGGLFGTGVGGAGIAAGSAAFGAGGYTGFGPFVQMGMAFNRGYEQPFQMGGVVDRRTSFGMANGSRGVMGEAGPEAVIPLKRGANGRLGIEGGTGGGSSSTTVNNVTVNAPAGAQNDPGWGQKVGKDVANALNGQVRAILVDEQRAGGVLRR